MREVLSLHLLDRSCCQKLVQQILVSVASPVSLTSDKLKQRTNPLERLFKC